tara:strand:+ start:1898 stop:2359 length:462 start_codon:yes stop_codon:yes gene_type:complete
MNVSQLLFSLAAVATTALITYNIYRLLKDISTWGNSLVPRTYERRSWTLPETVIVAYVSLNYKTSNKELISFVSDVLDRKESTIIRKMNRIRGVRTRKSLKASKNEIIAYDVLKGETSEFSNSAFQMATNNLSIVGISYQNFESILGNSIRIK